MTKSLIVVDCQNDFIRGSLACENGEVAVEEIISFINNKIDNIQVFYSCDWHSKRNKSFSVNGGIWPVHCVEKTEGASLDKSFYEDIKFLERLPIKEKNIFYKGMDDDIEEYSAYNAKNKNGEKLSNIIGDKVIVCGIASEFCVRETVKALLEKGVTVSILLKGVAYVNKKEHEKSIEDLEKKGVNIIR